MSKFGKKGRKPKQNRMIEAGTKTLGGIAEHFRSIDSAPKGYSVQRPSAVANGFLLFFFGMSTIVLGTHLMLKAYWMPDMFLYLIFFNPGPHFAVLPIRLFFISFFQISFFLITYFFLFLNIIIIISRRLLIFLLCILMFLLLTLLGNLIFI